MIQMKKIFILVIITFIFNPGNLLANCLNDRYGNPYCAPPNGGIIQDRYNVLQCGLGQCIKDRYNVVQCSNTPGGYATKDRYGSVKCTGRCVSGRSSLCERM